MNLGLIHATIGNPSEAVSDLFYYASFPRLTLKQANAFDQAIRRDAYFAIAYDLEHRIEDNPLTLTIQTIPARRQLLPFGEILRCIVRLREVIYTLPGQPQHVRRFTLLSATLSNKIKFLVETTSNWDSIFAYTPQRRCSTCEPCFNPSRWGYS
jgi:hypothetical protein